MKLQVKINRRFLILLLVVFSLAGTVLYFVLQSVVDNNLDEILTNRSDRIIRTLKYNPHSIDSAVSLDQSIDIIKISPTAPFRIYSDTIIFDSSDQEIISCRKVTFSTKVDSTFYKVSIYISRLETEDLVQLIFYFMLGLFILIFFILYLLNRKLSSSLWRPFYALVNQLKTYKVGQNSSVHFEATTIVEFQQLNEAVNALLHKAQSDFRNLKEFTENASHEIQTPLAIIKLKIESILQDNSLTPAQHQQLLVAFESASRLSKLNEALLLLSKIENRQFVSEEEIDLCSLIKRRLEFIEELIVLKKVNVKINLDVPVVVKINPYLAEMLVNNLINNALKHNFENGEITISSTERVIKISNTGNPLTMPAEKLFQRFVKQNSGSESTGLGLSIVSEICKSYMINIQYEYINGFHDIYLYFDAEKLINSDLK
jgi:signal transduction histidine kinase